MVFKKITFQNRYVALETPSRPPTFMAKTILNFHFDYLIPSLSDFWQSSSDFWQAVMTISTVAQQLPYKVFWLESDMILIANWRNDNLSWGELVFQFTKVRLWLCPPRSPSTFIIETKLAFTRYRHHHSSTKEEIELQMIFCHTLPYVLNINILS